MDTLFLVRGVRSGISSAENHKADFQYHRFRLQNSLGIGKLISHTVTYSFCIQYYEG